MKTTTVTKAEKMLAAELGAEAFRGGQPRVPALDKSINSLTKPYGIGQQSCTLLAAWLTGWDRANLAG